MRYRAFFSYARADDRIANWLHRQLDGYRTPKPLVGTGGELGPVPSKLHPIFRDRTDLESGGHVDAALQQALEDSETLIVLCTPTSAKSHWVNHEVETFLKLGREAAIFAVIAAGVPDSGDPETECFPPALRGKGLLAADLREIKLPTGQLVGDGREGGRLKLIAGLLGVKLDALVQRERRRQRQLMALLATATLLFASLAVFAGMQMLAADRNAREARSTLHRFFATQAWAKLEREDHQGAARYALAGLQLAPENSELFANVLAAALHLARESDPKIPLTHSGVRHAAFSPNGSRIVTTGADGVVKIWNARDGALLNQLASADANVSTAAFSYDGTRIVTTSRAEGTVRIWDTKGRALAAFRERSVETGAFSPDGTHVVTVSPDGVKLWNSSNAQLVLMLEVERLSSVEFSPDGNRILAGSHAGAAKIWDIKNGDEIASLSSEPGATPIAVYAPDGKWIATAGKDNTVGIWNASDGAFVRQFNGHTRSIRSIRFSPDSKHFVAAIGNGAKVWRLSDGRVVAEHIGDVLNAVFSPDSTLVAMTGRDTTQLWNAFDGNAVLTLPGAPELSGASFSPDSSHIVVPVSFSAARVWPIKANRVIRRLSGVGVVHDVDRSRVLTVGRENSAKVWSVAEGRLQETLSGNGEGIYAARFCPDGVGIITIDDDAIARVRRGAGEMQAATAPIQLGSSSTGLTATLMRSYLKTKFWVAAMSPDCTRFVTAGEDGAARVWSAIDGSLISKLYQDNQDQVITAEFSNDGSQIVTTGESTATRVWSATDGRRVGILRGFGFSGNAWFSKDATRIAVTDGETIRIWGVMPTTPDGWVLLTTLIGYKGMGHASFSPDGTRIATASDDGAKVWDTRSGVLIASLDARDVLSVAFSSDGSRIVTSDQDGVSVWDTRYLTQSADVLFHDACKYLLGPGARVFPREEREADTLLLSEWREHRDVCESIPGVSAITQSRWGDWVAVTPK